MRGTRAWWAGAVVAASLVCHTGCLAATRGDREGIPQAGKEVTLRLPASGRSIRVWLPRDYDPGRTWPVIFCYHGYAETPTTWPFRQFTDQKGFICVAMSYATKEWSTWLNLSKAGPELALFREAWQAVSKYARVDPKMVFMGGFSLGGYSTSVLGEQMLDKLAGLVIFAAGRAQQTMNPPDKEKIRGKPIFIAAGKKDWVHDAQARKAAQTYRAFGADVTFEEWPRVGHSVDTNSKTFIPWLLRHSILRNAPKDLAAAAADAEAGKLGKALVTYQRIAGLWKSSPLCRTAADAARKIADAAEKKLREAQKAIQRKQYQRATEILSAMLRSYEGSDFARQAKLLAPLAAPGPKPARPGAAATTRPAPDAG